jgi:hypothetical protein
MSSKINKLNNLDNLSIDNNKTYLINQIYINQFIIILFIIVAIYYLYINKIEQENEERILLKILKKL